MGYRSFPHELDFVVRMTMGTRTPAREGAEKEYGDVDITVVGPDEVMRAALKWQVLLANAVHPGMLPWWMSVAARRTVTWAPFLRKRGGPIDALGRSG
jgi:hypothetical protein